MENVLLKEQLDTMKELNNTLKEKNSLQDTIIANNVKLHSYADAVTNNASKNEIKEKIPNIVLTDFKEDINTLLSDIKLNLNKTDKIPLNMNVKKNKKKIIIHYTLLIVTLMLNK